MGGVVTPPRFVLAVLSIVLGSTTIITMVEISEVSVFA